MRKDSLYFKHGPNLAVYRQIEELQGYWERRWSGTNLGSLLKKARTGDLAELETPFSRHLPMDGPILEAGCGTGRVVCALQSRGYTVEGIDYASETITRVHAIDPSLDVRAGDIFAVDRPDGYYAAYISLGVLEHYQDGPGAGLIEAWRILRPGGVALLMVPYLNQARRRIYTDAPVLDLQSPPSGVRFYQYQYDEDDFARRICATGFEISERLPLQLFEGLMSDTPLGRRLQKNHFYSWKLNQQLKRLSEHMPNRLKRRHSHMLMYIAVKTA